MVQLSWAIEEKREGLGKVGRLTLLSLFSILFGDEMKASLGVRSFYVSSSMLGVCHFAFNFFQRERERVHREGQAQRGETEKGRERDKNGMLPVFSADVLLQLLLHLISRAKSFHGVLLMWGGFSFSFSLEEKKIQMKEELRKMLACLLLSVHSHYYNSPTCKVNFM